jgi:hypothetical protein
MIKVPGKTGWLDLAVAQPTTPTYADGEGCRLNMGTLPAQFSLGTMGTDAGSGWMIVVKVVIRNSATSLTEMRVNW